MPLYLFETSCFNNYHRELEIRPFHKSKFKTSKMLVISMPTLHFPFISELKFFLKALKNSCNWFISLYFLHPVPNLILTFLLQFLISRLLPLILGERQEHLLEASLTQRVALNVELLLSGFHDSKHCAPLHAARRNIVGHSPLVLLPRRIITK